MQVVAPVDSLIEVRAWRPLLGKPLILLSLHNIRILYHRKIDAIYQPILILKVRCSLSYNAHLVIEAFQSIIRRYLTPVHPQFIFAIILSGYRSMVVLGFCLNFL